jgi:hypothetical protein
MIYIFQIGDINIRRLINQTQTDKLVSYNYTIQQFDDTNNPYVQGDSQTRDTIYATLKYTIKGDTTLDVLEKLSYLTNSKDKNLIPIFGLKVLDESEDLSDNTTKEKYQIVYNVCRVIKRDQNNEPQIENLFNEQKNRNEYKIDLELVCKTTSFHNIEENLEVIESQALKAGGDFVPFDTILDNIKDRTHFVDRENFNSNNDYYICKAEPRLFSTSNAALEIAQNAFEVAQNNYIFGVFSKGVQSIVGFESVENQYNYPGGDVFFAPLSTAYYINSDIRNTGTKLADKAIIRLMSSERFSWINNTNTNLETGVFDKSGQLFEIYNSSTKTGFKIKWNRDYKSPVFYYRIHTSELFMRETSWLSGYEPWTTNKIISGGQLQLPTNTPFTRVFIRNYRQLLQSVPYSPGVEATLTDSQYSFNIANSIIYFNNANDGLNVTIETSSTTNIISADSLIFDGSVSIENISDFNNQVFAMSGLDNELDNLTVSFDTNLGIANLLSRLTRKQNMFGLYCPVQYIQN